MKDKFGKFRGVCNGCDECPEYQYSPESGTNSCDYCGCKPPKHEIVKQESSEETKATETPTTTPPSTAREDAASEAEAEAEERSKPETEPKSSASETKSEPEDNSTDPAPEPTKDTQATLPTPSEEELPEPTKPAADEVGSQVFISNEDSGTVKCLCFHPDTQTIWGGTSSGLVVVWDIRTKDVKVLKSPNSEGKAVNSITSVFGEVWSGSEDGIIRIWKATSLESACLEIELTGHEGSIECVAVVGNRVWSGSVDTTLRLWKIKEKKCEKILKAGVPIISLLKYDEKTVWVGTNTSIICLDSRGEPRGFFHGAHTSPINRMVRVGSLVWSGSNDSTIKIWNNELICQQTLSLENSPVFDVCSDEVSLAWAAYNSNRVDQWRSEGTDPDNVFSSTSSIVSLLLLPNNSGKKELWAGTENGVVVWNLGKSTVQATEETSEPTSESDSETVRSPRTQTLTIGSGGYWYPKSRENSVLKASSHGGMNSLVDFLQNAPPPEPTAKPKPLKKKNTMAKFFGKKQS